MSSVADRRLVVSSSATRRVEVVQQWLATHPTREVLLLAPTRGAADDLARLAARAGRGLLGAHRLTPSSVAAGIAVEPMAASNLAPLSALGATALAARSVHAASVRGELTYFQPVLDTPGFPRALGRTLRDLREQAVDDQTLHLAGPPGADLAALLLAFGHELGACSLVDTADVYRLAATVIEAGAHPLVGLPLALCDLSPTGRRQIEFLSALVHASPSVVATAVAGDGHGREALEACLGVTSDDLDRASQPANKLDRLRRFIFLTELPQVASVGEADSSVQLFFEPGEGRECVEIARRILAMAARGRPFDQVAVLLRNPEGYQPLIEDAFRRAGIPAWFSHGTARPDPGGRAFLALLSCAAEGLTATRFAEYLSLGQVPLPDAEGAPARREVPWVPQVGDQLVFFDVVDNPEPPPVNPGAPPDKDESPDGPVLGGTLSAPFHWEKLLVDAAVVGGRDRWARRLAGLRQELESKRQQNEEETDRVSNIDRQLQRLGHLERFALPVIEALTALPKSATWGTWLDALENLATLVLRRPESVLALLAELRPMDQVGPVELDEVRSVLSDRLSFLRNEPPRRRFGSVFVGALDEGRGRVFDAVFVPGLAEGVFPKKNFEDPLLLDGARRQVDAALRTRSRQVEEERLLLRVAVGCAGRDLIGSWPSIDTMQGRSRVPSFYALDILRAAEGRLPDLSDLAERTVAATRLGWPAPTNPELAIDDAEYDLAVIAPLLTGKSRDGQGRARFLLGANQRLARSLRARAGRWRRRWCAADGIVVGDKGLEQDDQQTLAVLQQHLPTARSYSPTALQTFATCPYKFLLQAVHRLRTRDEIVQIQQLDPLTRGSLFHEVLAELMRDLRNRSLLPLSSDRLDAVLDRADTLLDQVTERWHERLAPAIERVWVSEIESLRTDLRGALRTMVHADESWRPAYFELSFGLGEEPGRDEHSQDMEVVVLDGIRLRGSIDLVEEDDATGRLRITDYKTGKPPFKKYLVIGGGEILQPVLYALAAEQILNKPVAEGRLFFCTQRGEYTPVRVPNSEQSRQAVRDLLDIISTALGTGFLPAAPKAKGCEYCDYRPVCGPYEELRRAEVKTDQRPLLARLEKLRKRE